MAKYYSTTTTVEKTPITINLSDGAQAWLVASFIIAVLGGILVYGSFVAKKTGKKNWLRSFLGFDRMMLEALMKILYLIGAIFITLFSFVLIPQSVVAFLLVLILGNVGYRLVFEFTMLTIQLWKNTTEIKEAITEKPEKSEKKEKKAEKK